MRAGTYCIHIWLCRPDMVRRFAVCDVLIFFLFFVFARAQINWKSKFHIYFNILPRVNELDRKFTWLRALTNTGPHVCVCVCGVGVVVRQCRAYTHPVISVCMLLVLKSRNYYIIHSRRKINDEKKKKKKTPRKRKTDQRDRRAAMSVRWDERTTIYS